MGARLLSYRPNGRPLFFFYFPKVSPCHLVPLLKHFYRKMWQRSGHYQSGGQQNHKKGTIFCWRTFVAPQIWSENKNVVALNKRRKKLCQRWRAYSRCFRTMQLLFFFFSSRAHCWPQRSVLFKRSFWANFIFHRIVCLYNCCVVICIVFKK